jgi:hypothetical protein
MTSTQKTRGNKKPARDTQRVFFCCDRRNTADREGLIADLLSQDAGMDCLVSYLETHGNIDMEAGVNNGGLLYSVHASSMGRTKNAA